VVVYGFGRENQGWLRVTAAKTRNESITRIIGNLPSFLVYTSRKPSQTSWSFLRISRNEV
jgi:hypothetical protein